MHAERSFDVVGVGFGPANLALALLISECRAGQDHWSSHFFEKQPEFGWHRDMLLDGATMQISFLKDLATQRNPRSSFTFINYLAEKKRLNDFINLKSFYPSRVEFHDYLNWCADAVLDQVSYAREVTEITVDHSSNDSAQAALKVHTKISGSDCLETNLATRAVVIAQGLVPRFPEGIQPCENIWHNARFLNRISEVPREGSFRFAVVGAGQSAAEIAAFLYAQFPNAQIHNVLSRFGYAPADSSPFINRIFDPDAVDLFHSRSPNVRKRILADHTNTNYSVVDEVLIENLYNLWYHDRLQSRPRLHFENRSRLLGIEQTNGELTLHLGETGGEAKRVLKADYLICATGYVPASVETLLSEEIKQLLRRNSAGQPRVTRDFRLEIEGDKIPPIYIQGTSEEDHGLSTVLISNLAVRAAEIKASIDSPSHFLRTGAVDFANAKRRSPGAKYRLHI